MALVFIITGLLVLVAAIGIYYIYSAFFTNNSHTLMGIVVGNTEDEYNSKDALGRINDTMYEQRITVEFCTNKRYRFEATVAHFTQDNRVGANVAVVLNKKYPNTAKLASALSGYAFIAKLLGTLGCIFLLAGIWLLNIDQLRRTFTSSFTWIWCLGICVFLSFIARKVYLLSQSHPLFTPNVVEVDDTL